MIIIGQGAPQASAGVPNPAVPAVITSQPAGGATNSAAEVIVTVTTTTFVPAGGTARVSGVAAGSTGQIAGTGQLAGIIASSRPAGAGSIGIPQPPSASAQAINSATLGLDGLLSSGNLAKPSGSSVSLPFVTPGATGVGMSSQPVGVSSAAVIGSLSSPNSGPTTARVVSSTTGAPAGVAAASNGVSAGAAANINSATLQIAGLVKSPQPGSAATLGIPQPPSPIGTPTPINSQTLARANIVRGSDQGAGATPTQPGTAPTAVTVFAGGATNLLYQRVPQVYSILTCLVFFLL